MQQARTRSSLWTMVSDDPDEEGGVQATRYDGIFVCRVCGVPQAHLGWSMKVCGQCCGEYYCSHRCQKAHWKQHRLQCKRRLEAHIQACEDRKRFVHTFTIDLQVSLLGVTTWYFPGCYLCLQVCWLQAEIARLMTSASRLVQWCDVKLVAGSSVLDSAQTLADAGLTHGAELTAVFDDELCPSVFDFPPWPILPREADGGN